jgi:hypothetical protein
MSETLRPWPGEEWRAYYMSPLGPAPVTSLVRVVEVVPDIQSPKIVRYHQVYPEWDEQVQELSLDAFVGGRVAPYEDVPDWEKRRSAGPARPDEEPT